MLFFMAWRFNSRFTKLNTFSIRFISQLRGGIAKNFAFTLAKPLRALAQFCIGQLSCTNSFVMNFESNTVIEIDAYLQ